MKEELVYCKQQGEGEGGGEGEAIAGAGNRLLPQLSSSLPLSTCSNGQTWAALSSPPPQHRWPRVALMSADPHSCLSFISCLLFVVWWTCLFVVCCLLFVVCCLFVVCLFVVCLLFICCLLFVFCCCCCLFLLLLLLLLLLLFVVVTIPFHNFLFEFPLVLNFIKTGSSLSVVVPLNRPEDPQE